MTQPHSSHEQIIIVGSGPAGLTSGIYTARAQLKPLIFEGSTPGGQLMGTTSVENWPGDISIMGPELMINMRDHAAAAGARFSDEIIKSIDTSKYPFTLTTTNNKHYTADAVIVATGATPKRVGCPGESEYWGKGVSTCAVCDGALYKDKRVLIVGGGDTAMEDASFMARFTPHITVVHIRDKLSASIPMQQRVLNNPSTKIHYNATITEVEGNGSHVTGATITSSETNTSFKLPVDGVFIAIGLTPNSAILGPEVARGPGGYILTYGSTTQTSVPGIFATGDVVDFRYKQAIASAGDGCRAALDAERFLATKSN